MKSRRIRNIFTTASALLLAPAALAQDQNGTWNTTTSGQSWATPGNWLDSKIANGSGFTANFNTLNISGDITVNLDGARTVGNLIFGDTDTTSAAGWIIATGSGGPLTLAGTTPTITVNALASGRFATIDAVLAGTVGFTKNGEGILRLRNASNSISGPVIVSAGELRLAVAALTNATTVALNGGILTTATSAANAIGGTISFNGGTLQYNNDPGTDYSAQFSTADNQQYRINVITASGTPRVATYATALSSLGGSLVKLGEGTLILSAANTFNGITTVSSGTLQLNNALALQNSAIDTTNSIAGTTIAGIVLNSVTSPTFGGLTGNKNLASLFDTDSGNYGSVTNVTLNPGTGADHTYTGVIADGRPALNGGMTLTKTGAGRQVLGVANTYTGGTILNGGTLNYSNATALSSGPITFTGGTILQAGVATTLANNISVNAEIVGTVGTAGFATTISGAITGDGILAKGGNGVLTLTGGLANTIAGGFRVTTGRLEILDGRSLTNAGPVTVLSGASLNYSKNFDNGNDLTNAITLSGSGDGSFGALNLRGNATATGAITLAADATISHDFNTATISGSITGTDRNLTLRTLTTTVAQPGMTVSGPISLGTGSLTVTGVANTGGFSIRLTGENTYSGGTTVTAGTLQVNNTTGSGTGSGLVTVNSGATLGGTGTIGGAVNVSGVLSPGADIVSLGTGTLTFISGSIFEYEMDTSTVGADLLHVSGALSIGSNVMLDLTDLATSSQTLAIDTKFSLFSYTGVWNNGTFNGYADDSTFLFANNEWRINYNDLTGGSNFTGNQAGATGFVTLTVIPEPSSIGLLGLGGVGALLVRRRRPN
jgi:autotransporter-associated beta strand protein